MNEHVTKDKYGVYYMRLLQGYSETDKGFKKRVDKKIKWLNDKFTYIGNKNYGNEVCLTYII